MSDKVLYAWVPYQSALRITKRLPKKKTVYKYSCTPMQSSTFKAKNEKSSVPSYTGQVSAGGWTQEQGDKQAGSRQTRTDKRRRPLKGRVITNGRQLDDWNETQEVQGARRERETTGGAGSQERKRNHRETRPEPHDPK